MVYSSSDLHTFDIDKSCLPEWLDYFLKQGDFYLSLIDITKGAATVHQPKKLYLKLNYRFQIP